MLITFAGTEGTGKTTIAKLLVGFLEANGYNVVHTREPGATRIGKDIRKILLDPENKILCPKAELLLYAADRAQHLEEVVLPAISLGKIVVSDRFHDCTIAYQGFGRSVDLDMINNTVEIALNGLKPNITIWLNMDSKKAVERAIGAYSNEERSMKESRFDFEQLEFHERVRQGYLHCAINDPDRFVMIDADQSVDKVLFDITKEILPRIKSQHSKKYISA